MAARMTKAQAFTLLGVDENASEADIRSAYRYVWKTTFNVESGEAFAIMHIYLINEMAIRLTQLLFYGIVPQHCWCVSKCPRKYLCIGYFELRSDGIDLVSCTLVLYDWFWYLCFLDDYVCVYVCVCVWNSWLIMNIDEKLSSTIQIKIMLTQRPRLDSNASLQRMNV